MPGYAETNFLDARRPLPAFFWTGRTEMNCSQAIGDTKRQAYAHHIQRLMVTGNFALLAGLSPAEVEQWYLLVYADAFEWVELPTPGGMALFDDGGVMASKPYAASGAYIDRMSDYCANCRFRPDVKLGPKACPFNYLYWDFLIRNEAKLKANLAHGHALSHAGEDGGGEKGGDRAAGGGVSGGSCLAERGPSSGLSATFSPTLRAGEGDRAASPSPVG